MSSIKIIETRDGSHSLLNEQLNETYHSVHGALQESQYVFIQQGLNVISKGRANKPVTIFEVGFGTGLNALLTLELSVVEKTSIDYTTLEAFPIEEGMWSKLNYASTADSKIFFERLHQSAWNQSVAITPTFRFLKLLNTLQQVALEPNRFDLVYFDAFAPNKQPEMWALPILEKVIAAMSPGGIFVTYCAKGQLKRDLRSLGLQVEALQGPPGKREMIRGTKR